MDNENIAIEEVAKIVKSKNPEEANIINSILNMKPKNVTPGQEVLAAKLILLIFETLNNLRINYCVKLEMFKNINDSLYEIFVNIFHEKNKNSYKK